MSCSCGAGGIGQLVVVGEGTVSVSGSGTATDPYRVGTGQVSSTLQLEVRDSSTVNMTLFGSGTRSDPYIIRADTSSASSLRGLSDVSTSPAVQQGAVPLWIGSQAGGRFEFRLPGVRYTTNATRGTGTYQGEQIRETDTGKRYEWDGTQWLDLTPASVPPSALDPSVVQNVGTLANTTDWNSLTTRSGIYRVGGWNSGLNTPPGAYNYGTLLVYISGQSVSQTYFAHGTSYFYHRTKFNASDWTDWKRAANFDELSSEITSRQNDVNSVRNDQNFDIARITHSGYNSGGRNGFWQGYLPATYYDRGQIDSAFTSRDNNINGRATYDYVNGVRDAINGTIGNQTRIAGGAVGGMNSTATASVGFPGGRFSALPGIALGIYTGSTANQHAGIINAGTGGFTLYYYREGGGGNATVGWVAVQGY